MTKTKNPTVKKLNNNQTVVKYVLDAENKKIGRVATEAAVLLMGKNLQNFKRNTVPNVSVEIINTSKSDINVSKRKNKTYSRYSGYPGGLKKPTMNQVINRNGYGKLYLEAILGMLPKNKLRSKMINNLKVTE